MKWKFKLCHLKSTWSVYKKFLLSNSYIDYIRTRYILDLEPHHGYIISLCDCAKVFEGARIIVKPDCAARALCRNLDFPPPPISASCLDETVQYFQSVVQTELSSLLNCPINWIKQDNHEISNFNLLGLTDKGW